MRRLTTTLAAFAAVLVTALAVLVAGGIAVPVAAVAPATTASRAVHAALTTAPARASNPFRIAKINYAQGATLNSEYLVVHNVSRHRHSLTGYLIVDPNDNQRYRFPKTVLRAGMSVTLHTGHGHNRAHHRYWGQDDPMWNNDGDQAQLRNPQGRVVDRCSYDGTEGGTKLC
ncbi:MAG TPA: lamin tail domain-containing protein [Nocardioidaceae bacterium]|nr:lamin tail domain-containing protein [Nocardioidaceae bacterium]